MKHLDYAQNPHCVDYNPFVPSATHSRQSLSRVLGYKPLRMGSGLKRVFQSVALAVPCALFATGISDSAVVSDFVRYAISPGTAVAVRIVHVKASHRGMGVFLDALNWYGSVMSLAFAVNAILYGLLIFGIMTTISAMTDKNSNR